MKVEKIKELADFIESIPPKRFNISNWVSEIMGSNNDYYQASQTLDINVCKTAGCIAGWAMALENGGTVTVPKISLPSEAKEIATIGAEILGLEYQKAVRLFYVDEESAWVEYVHVYEHLLDCYGDDEFEWSKESEDDLAGYLSDNGVINNKVAAFMLRQVANGEVVL